MVQNPKPNDFMILLSIMISMFVLMGFHKTLTIHNPALSFWLDDMIILLGLLAYMGHKLPKR